MQARNESARAVAARDFMLSLFKSADQEKARGADITARELLETGRKDVLTRLATQPRLQAELLQGIATIQKDMGEYTGADSTFADAARIYEQLGMPREAALARAAEADAAVRMGDMKLAQSVLQQAKDVADRPKADAELNSRLNEVEGWIAFAQRDAARAKDLFQQSHQQALQAFGLYHTKTRDALRGWIYAERELRHFDQALQLLGELERTAAGTSGVGATGAAAMARDRADILLLAGHWVESLDQVLVALPRCISDLGPNHAECKELIFRKVTAMVRLGMTRRAADDLPALEVIANDEKSPALAVDTRLLILKLDPVTRPSARQTASFEQLRSLVESDALTRFGPRFKIKARLALAEARLVGNDPVEAERWIRDALALQRRQDGSVPATVLGALTKSLEGISLLQRGQVDEALQSLVAAHAEESKLVGSDDPTTCLFSLNLAIALAASGRGEEALAVVARAEPVLRKAMGANAPMYLRVRELQNELERSYSPEARAHQIAKQGLDFWNTHPSFFSS
jgi:tetratricopeptide (TPR) repeat protein